MALVTQPELSAMLGMSITTERFTVLYDWGLGVVKTAYSGDPELAVDDALAVVTNVIRSVLIRLATNPSGAQMTSSDSAQVTFPSRDAFQLTDAERRDLEALGSGSEREAFSVSPYYEPVSWEPWL